MLAASACTNTPDRAPRPAAVEPARGDPATATPVVIHGDSFYVEATASAQGAAGDTLDARYRAWLGNVELEQVRWVDGRTLAAVVPAGLPLGEHDLLVESAAGRRGTLQAAFRVAIPAPDLRATASFAPASATVGQAVSVVATVANAGNAAALGVLPVPSLSGPGALALVQAPQARDVLPGTSTTFQFAYLAAGAGSVSGVVDVAGTDARSGGTVTAPRADAGTVVIGSAASLSASAAASSATASPGQIVTVTLQVANAGAAPASAVTPAMVATGPVALVLAPTAQDVPGGQSRAFTWTYTASAPGAATFTASAAGTDANSGAPVSAQASGVALAIVSPASLQATLSMTSASTLSVGQTIAVALTVTNQGQAEALGVIPTALSQSGSATATPGTGPTPAGPVDLAAGASATFRWTLAASGPGSMTFSAGAQGRDGNSSAVVSASATSGALQVQRPASLNIAFAAVPARVNLGQSFDVSVAVGNAGEAGARSVSASIAPAVSGAGVTPTSSNLAGGASTTFTRRFTAIGVGPVTFPASAAGTDANSGAAIATPTITAPLVVELPSALQATLSIPASIPLGDFTASMTVTNTGDATATAVVPGTLATATGNTVTVTLVSAPVGSLDVPGGGGQVTFTWVCHVAAAGTVRLQASAGGTDANSGASVTTGTVVSGSGTVVSAQVVKLADDPFGDGTAFAQLLAYGGKLVLAPSQDGSAVKRMNGDGTSPESLALAFPKDGNATGDRSSNIWAGAPPYPSIGASGCTWNTRDCGPNNEAGRAAWGAGVLGGMEWLLAAGATSSSQSSYVYLTSSSSGPLAFRYADLTAQMPGAARALSSVLFDVDRVYLGLAGAKPSLVALHTVPGVTGLEATSADLVDLQLNLVSGVKNGRLVDALGKFQGRLYVANAGGMARATVDPPTGASDFVSCTPSDPDWSAGTSNSTGKFADLLPADRAISAFATWNGRLFAARNTSMGILEVPQVWQCSPSTSGDPTQCEPADWIRVAKDSFGRGSGQNNLFNRAVTLLAATPAWLYVGYDNWFGIEVFRTSTATPVNSGDWQSVGGAGLGDTRNTHILDARVLTVGGVANLYVAAGDDNNAVRIYRMLE